MNLNAAANQATQNWILPVASQIVAHRDNAAGALFGADLVAQIFNLPYRRLSVGRSFEGRRPADWKSAIQQVENLRYPGRGPAAL